MTLIPAMALTLAALALAWIAVGLSVIVGLYGYAVWRGERNDGSGTDWDGVILIILLWPVFGYSLVEEAKR